MITPSSHTGSSHQREIHSSPINSLRPAELERNERIERYLPLVGRTVAKIRRNLPAHVDVNELYSAGVMGLIAAIGRFDPAQSSTFEGYACIRIRGAILDALRQSDLSSRRSRAQNRKIQAAVYEAEQIFGRAPTDIELSEQLGISVSELNRRREAAAPTRVVSLDSQAFGSETSDKTLHNAMADDNQECVRITIEKRELVQFLADRMAELPDVQKRILALYYFEGVQFSEIAVVFGCSASRIGQLHREAVTKLKLRMRSARQS